MGKDLEPLDLVSLPKNKIQEKLMQYFTYSFKIN